MLKKYCFRITALGFTKILLKKIKLTKGLSLIRKDKQHWNS